MSIQYYKTQISLPSGTKHILNPHVGYTSVIDIVHINYDIGILR